MARRLARWAAAAAAAVALTGAVALRVLAAEASASPIAGDPRSPGEGPGLVGEPLLAIGAVVAIAVVAVVATLAYVRATGGAGRDDPARRR